MNPQRLALFSAIVHAGSISQAASTLGMGKSVLSRQLVDFADKLSQHFGPILSHMVKDKFTYSIVDKSTSLACS